MPVPSLIRVMLCSCTLTVLMPGFRTVTDVYAQVQCWAPRQDEGPVTDKRRVRQFRAMRAAEAIVRQSQEFLNPPTPVRMRTTMVVRSHESPVSRVILRAYPEKVSVGIGLWKGVCGLIPQVDRVAQPFGQIRVFFNDLSRDMFMDQDEIPKLTGTLGGFPEYNGWLVISKNGRLPWIPQTLGERLDRIGAVREKALVDWQHAQASRKGPDQAAVDRTAALLRKTDAEVADKYAANMKQLAAEIQSAQARDAARQAHLIRQRDEYRAYRSSFTAEQLAMPAVWGDADGSAREVMEAQIMTLHELSIEDQQKVGYLREQARGLEREAAMSSTAVEAQRLRAQASDLLLEAEQVEKSQLERAALAAEALRSSYELTNLKPGFAEQALAYKMDPTFLERSHPGKIQVIAISTMTLTENDVLGQPEQAARKAWLDRTRLSLDYAALAALLD